MKSEPQDPNEKDLLLEETYKAKYERAIHFIEMTEALTYDPKTEKRISDFLIQEGVWQPLPKEQK